MKPENTIEYIKYRGLESVKKTFSVVDHRYDSASTAVLKFSKYRWFPKVYSHGPDYIIYKKYSNNLYTSHLSLSKKEKNVLYMGIISALYDIYKEGYSHRDIHAKNVLYDRYMRPIIIDYELMAEHNFKLPFTESYDITGNGLPSPYCSNNNCVTKDYEVSINKILGYSNADEIHKIISSLT